MSNHVAVRKMLNYLLQSYEIKQIQFNFFSFFIIIPCILLSIKFIHQQMHSLLNLTKF